MKSTDHNNQMINGISSHSPSYMTSEEQTANQFYDLISHSAIYLCDLENDMKGAGRQQ